MSVANVGMAHKSYQKQHIDFCDICKMQIVTLTTDLGTADHYAAAVKGALLSVEAQLNIIDVTHQIPAHDLTSGAHALKNTYGWYPQGSIHIVLLQTMYATDCRLLVFRRDGHTFIAPDNGVLSLVFVNELALDVQAIAYTCDHVSPVVPVLDEALRVALGREPIQYQIEQPSSIEQRFARQPVVNEHSIRGVISHIDTFGNVITNIPKKLFERIGQGRAYTIQYGRHDTINTISTTYADAAPSEVLAFFNSSQLLEIAVNLGHAAEYLSLKKHDGIIINFIGPLSIKNEL